MHLHAELGTRQYKLLKEALTFFSESKELKKEIVAAKVSKTISGVLEEHSNHQMTCIRMGDPTRVLPSHFVMPDSPAVASLLQDRSEVAECNEMARKLGLLKGQDGVKIHIATDDFTAKPSVKATSALATHTNDKSSGHASERVHLASQDIAT